MESSIIATISKETGMDFEEVRHEAAPLSLTTTWQDSYHDGSAGCSRHKTAVYAETTDGKLHQLPEVVGDRWSTNYAHQGGHDNESEKSLGQAITDRGIIPLAIYVAYEGSDSWSGQDDFSECSLTRHPWSPPNFTKIRRRLEDHLRKMEDNSLLMQLAGIAGVKLDSDRYTISTRYLGSVWLPENRDPFEGKTFPSAEEAEKEIERVHRLDSAWGGVVYKTT